MRKGGGLRKYEKSSSRVWREAKYRGEKARKVEYSEGKKL